MRQPPEKLVTGRSSVSLAKPRPFSNCAARRGAVAVDGLELVLGLEPRRVVIVLRQGFFQRTQFNVAVEHKLNRRLLRGGDLLLHKRNRLAGLQRHLAALRLDFAAYQAKQRGLAAAVMPDQADALVGKRL
jgi:hypothetical protein